MYIKIRAYKGVYTNASECSCWNIFFAYLYKVIVNILYKYIYNPSCLNAKYF